MKYQHTNLRETLPTVPSPNEIMLTPNVIGTSKHICMYPLRHAGITVPPPVMQYSQKR